MTISRREIHVIDLHPEQLAFAGTGMSGGGKQRIQPGMIGVLPDMGKQAGDLRQRQVEALPQLVHLLRRQARYLPHDFLPRLKTRLLIGFGITQAAMGIASGNDRHPDAPIPRGA